MNGTWWPSVQTWWPSVDEPQVPELALTVRQRRQFVTLMLLTLSCLFFLFSSVSRENSSKVHRQTMLFSETIFGAFSQRNHVSYFKATSNYWEKGLIKYEYIWRNNLLNRILGGKPQLTDIRVKGSMSMTTMLPKRTQSLRGIHNFLVGKQSTQSTRSWI